jgi:hypothetical protein
MNLPPESYDCPNCGKPMAEMPTFPGYWKCPDYSVPLNDAPPYRFKCEGSHLTAAGAAAFDEVLVDRWLKRQTEQN